MDFNSGILSENTKANYTERYDLLLKIKNHVSKFPFRPKLASENQTNNLRQNKSFTKSLGQSVTF